MAQIHAIPPKQLEDDRTQREDASSQTASSKKEKHSRYTVDSDCLN